MELDLPSGGMLCEAGLETAPALSVPRRAGPRLVTRNHPLPLTTEESIQLDFILMVLAALFVLIPFCYLSGARAALFVSQAKAAWAPN